MTSYPPPQPQPPRPGPAYPTQPHPGQWPPCAATAPGPAPRPPAPKKPRIGLVVGALVVAVVLLAGAVVYWQLRGPGVGSSTARGAVKLLGVKWITQDGADTVAVSLDLTPATGTQGPVAAYCRSVGPDPWVWGRPGRDLAPAFPRTVLGPGQRVRGNLVLQAARGACDLLLYDKVGLVGRALVPGQDAGLDPVTLATAPADAAAVAPADPRAAIRAGGLRLLGNRWEEAHGKSAVVVSLEFTATRDDQPPGHAVHCEPKGGRGAPALKTGVTLPVFPVGLRNMVKGQTVRGNIRLDAARGECELSLLGADGGKVTVPAHDSGTVPYLLPATPAGMPVTPVGRAVRIVHPAQDIDYTLTVHRLSWGETDLGKPALVVDLETACARKCGEPGDNLAVFTPDAQYLHAQTDPNVCGATFDMDAQERVEKTTGPGARCRRIATLEMPRRQGVLDIGFQRDAAFAPDLLMQLPA